jgi:hypothetical protein
MHCLMDVQEPLLLIFLNIQSNVFFSDTISTLRYVFTCKLTSLPSRVRIIGTQSTFARVHLSKP